MILSFAGRTWGTLRGGLGTLLLLALLGVAPGMGVQARETPGPAGTISIGQLPPEGREVLERIDRGGPFRYSKDGSVFGNREGRLPRHPRGYYHEYTVPTPGARDRGPRRLIAGVPGERYYTGDHYRTFLRVQP